MVNSSESANGGALPKTGTIGSGSNGDSALEFDIDTPPPPVESGPRFDRTSIIVASPGAFLTDKLITRLGLSDAQLADLGPLLEQAFLLDNGRRSEMLVEAITHVIGPVRHAAAKIFAAVQSNMEPGPLYFDLSDGRRMYTVDELGKGGQGAVLLSIDASKAPSDPALLAATKILSVPAAMDHNIGVWTTLQQAGASQKIGRAVDPNAERLARFNVEAEILKLLMQHEGLQHIAPRIYDKDVTREGLPVMTIEHIPGVTLSDLMNTDALRSNLRLFYDLAADTALKLSDLHSFQTDDSDRPAGIVHRDIKPANLILQSNGKGVRVIDFGLAKGDHENLRRLGSHTSPGTRTNMGMGTSKYIAPEQVSSAKKASFPADVYSFAATFIHAVTGEPVFDGESDLAIALKHADASQIPSEALVRLKKTGVHPSLVQLFGRALSKKPEDRPTMQEMFDALALHTSFVKDRGMTPKHLGEAIRKGDTLFNVLGEEASTIGFDLPLPSGFPATPNDLRGTSAFARKLAESYPLGLPPPEYLDEDRTGPYQTDGAHEDRTSEYAGRNGAESGETVAGAKNKAKRTLSRIQLMVGGTVISLAAIVAGAVLWPKGSTESQQSASVRRPDTSGLPPARKGHNPEAHQSIGSSHFSVKLDREGKHIQEMTLFAGTVGEVVCDQQHIWEVTDADDRLTMAYVHVTPEQLATMLGCASPTELPLSNKDLTKENSDRVATLRVLFGKNNDSALFGPDVGGVWYDSGEEIRYHALTEIGGFLPPDGLKTFKNLAKARGVTVAKGTGFDDAAIDDGLFQLVRGNQGGSFSSALPPDSDKKLGMCYKQKDLLVEPSTLSSNLADAFRESRAKLDNASTSK